MLKRGFFIVFEGPDKSGKTTQARLLKDYLDRKGYKVKLTREPGGTIVSEKIRDIILDPKNNMSALCELFLYEASRADHVENLIKPSLNDGYIVISDRFTLASVVYQGFARGLGIDLVNKLNEIAINGLNIDIIFGFKLSIDDYFKRSSNNAKDRMEMEDKKFLESVFSAYYRLFEENKGIIVVDASKSIDEIHLFITREVEKKLHGNF